MRKLARLAGETLCAHGATIKPIAMRIRSIKPEFWSSESVGRLSRDARLLFIGLWSLADDSGRLRGALTYIAGSLLAYDGDAVGKVGGWVEELEREKMVRRYKCGDGNTYLDIPNWLKHQKIERPSASKLPAFTEGSPKPQRKLTEGSPQEQGIGNRDQGRGSGIIHSVLAGPVPVAEKVRERNPLMDALAEVGGADARETPKARWSSLGKVLADIRSVSPDVTGEEIRRRAGNLAQLYPTIRPTPESLGKWWAQCAKRPETLFRNPAPTDADHANGF